MKKKPKSKKRYKEGNSDVTIGQHSPVQLVYAEHFRLRGSELLQMSLEVAKVSSQPRGENPAENAGRVEKIPLQSHCAKPNCSRLW